MMAEHEGGPSAAEEGRSGKKEKKPKEKKELVVPEGLDLLQRDPNQLNLYVKTLWEDVIGEPEGAHSDDCVWINAFKCFNGGKSCCYTCLTFVCSIPLALCWGCFFACTTFTHIWQITPCFRLFNLYFSCVAKFLRTCVHCFCDPCYESMALMWTKVYINIVKNANEYKSGAIDEMNMVRSEDIHMA